MSKPLGILDIAGMRIEVKGEIRHTEHTEILMGVVIEGRYKGRRVVIKIPRYCRDVVAKGWDTLSPSLEMKRCLDSARVVYSILRREKELANRLRDVLGNRADELFRLPIAYHEYAAGDVLIPVLVYEYCEYALDDKRVKDRKLEVVESLLAVADALEELHRLGVAHLDVRGSNILFCNGRWKLSDLDAAVETGPTCSMVSLSGRLIPPPGYMPPELAPCLEGLECEVCTSTDTYMLVVTAAHLLNPDILPVIHEKLKDPRKRPPLRAVKGIIRYLAGLLKGYKLTPHPSTPVKPNTIIVTPGAPAELKRDTIAYGIGSKISQYISRKTIAKLHMDNLGLLIIEYTPHEHNWGFMICSHATRECRAYRELNHRITDILLPGDLLGIVVTRASYQKLLEYTHKEGQDKLEKEAYELLKTNHEILQKEGFNTEWKPLLLYQVTELGH